MPHLNPSDAAGNVTCHWTGRLVPESEAVKTPPFIPQVEGHWLAHPDYREARRQSYILFADSEANCNTCRHLERVPHEPNAAKMLYGRCRSTPMDHPYPIRDGVITFHADDSMNMECYESRFPSPPTLERT